MNLLKKVGLGLLVLLLTASLLGIINPDTANAAVAGKWITPAKIEYNGQQYEDTDNFDNNIQYEAKINDNCTSTINGFKNGNSSMFETNASLNQANINYAGAGCPHFDNKTDDFIEASSDTINLADPHKARELFRWVDAGRIQGTINGTVFEHDSTADKTAFKVFLRVDEAQTGCPDTVSVYNPEHGAPKATYFQKSSDCDLLDTIDFTIGNITARNNIPGDGETDPTLGNGSSNGVDAEEINTCESKSGPLGWLMCSGIDVIDGMMNWVDQNIQRLLIIDEQKYTNNQLKKAWGTIRNIAFIILVPIMLVMVIGTAIGVEAFSAYTVKKALPRMVIAIIFITLSWYICVFLIDLFNVIGSGVLGIITSPFRAEMVDICRDGQLNLGCLFSAEGPTASNLGPSVLRSIVTTGANAGLVLGLVIFLLVYAIPLTFGAVAAFLVLLLRQMFIIGLVLLSPLAILAWIFPGNDKFWQFWWNAFTKLLIMFPLIMGIIAMGRVFAWLINVSDGGALDGSVIQPIMKLGAYLLPYAVIPFTFKFAGGIFANLAGMVNDKDKGLIDRATGLRNKGLKKLHDNTTDGTGRLGSADSKLGNTYRRAASMGRNGSFSRTQRGRSRWEEQELKHREHVADRLLEEGGGRGFNDDDSTELLRDSTMTRSRFIKEYAAKINGRTHPDGTLLSEDERKEEAQRALARSELAIGARVGSSAMVVAAQKFRVAMTNTAYEPGEAGLQQMQDEMKDLQAKGLMTAVDGAGWMKSNRGRADFSANGFNDTIGFAAGAKTASEQLKGAFNGADPREIVGSHQRTVEGFAEQARINFEAALEEYNQARASGDISRKNSAERQMDISSADLASVYETLGNISSKKAQEWADTVFGRGVNDNGEMTTIRTVMEKSRSKAAGQHGEHTFLERKREYGSGRDAQQAGNAAEAIQPREGE